MPVTVKRHACAVARAGIVVPVTDQQEGKDAGQFPEDDEQNEIARKHDAEHRAHESQEEGEEPRNRIFGDM